jgi:hypothetical protein
MRPIKIIIIVFIIGVISCNYDIKNNSFQELKQSYWLYSPVIQVVDKDTEKYEFIFSGDKLTNKEANALLIVLRRKNYEYKITIDSQIMVSKISAPNIESLSFVESELREVLHDSSSMWKWK